MIPLIWHSEKGVIIEVIKKISSFQGLTDRERFDSVKHGGFFCGGETMQCNVVPVST